MTGQAKRLCRAAGVLGCALLAIVIATMRPWAASSSGSAGTGPRSEAAGSVRASEDQGVAETVFSAAGGADVEWGVLPESFTAEAFDPVQLGAVDTARMGDCAGVVFNGDVPAVSAQVQQALEQHGWVHARDGDADASGLYHRAQGSHRWAYVQCSEAAGSVCVTVALWKEDWG